LNGLEKITVENRELFALEDLPLEGDFPNVKAIAKQVGEGAPREWYAAVLARITYNVTSSPAGIR
jgi:hypothetical protein